MTASHRHCVCIRRSPACIGARPAQAADVLQVANVSRTLFSLPLWVAQRQGFMKDEGLDTTSHILDNAEKINAALRSGQMQIAMGTPEAVVIDAYNGGTLRIIAGNTGRLPHFIITKPEIKTLAQLRGANIGILSEKEGSTYVVQDIAKAIGLTPGRLQDDGGRRRADPLAAAQGRQDRRRPAAVPAELRGRGRRLQQSRLGDPVRAGLAVHHHQCRPRNGRRRTATSWCASCAPCSAAATS